jgi:thioredoxin 1
MASANVLLLTDQNFESEVLKSEVPVLVDFTATWCGPCKVLAPMVEQIADVYKGKIKVGKLDIDDAPTIAAKYKVKSVPTVVLFGAGAEQKRHVGIGGINNMAKLVQVLGIGAAA